MSRHPDTRHPCGLRGFDGFIRVPKHPTRLRHHAHLGAPLKLAGRCAACPLSLQGAVRRGVPFELAGRCEARRALSAEGLTRRGFRTHISHLSTCAARVPTVRRRGAVGGLEREGLERGPRLAGAEGLVGLETEGLGAYAARRRRGAVRGPRLAVGAAVQGAEVAELREERWAAELREEPSCAWSPGRNYSETRLAFRSNK